MNETGTVYFIGNSKAVEALVANHPAKPTMQVLRGDWELIFASLKDNQIKIWDMGSSVSGLHNTSGLSSIRQSDVVFVVSSTPEQLKAMIAELASTENPGRFLGINFYFYGISKDKIDGELLKNIENFSPAYNKKLGFIFDPLELQQIFGQASKEAKGTHTIENPGFNLPPLDVEPLGVESPKKSNLFCNKYGIGFFVSGAPAAALGLGVFFGALPLTPLIMGLIAVSAVVAALCLTLYLINYAGSKSTPGLQYTSAKEDY